ncbi:MAG: 30S ribosomal protein S13 [Candidatus Liptonbacteria bacterium RIFOXYB1_FULL_36_10]|uniref:Small ribosomal subunit protein uS13 n=2 Tax=Candidatus Liptoniibacteriota TaxID=1817909 RepID=A0A1G2CLC0_9BACT|nr:MAG: 30S ribosomal protein S13 [Candidatus Liptonbacteria bacterium RIFOXYB1_FULL_36_10]OGZ04241.1 MAG: 30S ribosomal protein S13 [Candidatus Liptonbacteria bacterium RIFOXYD1_FULL_36_11]
MRILGVNIPDNKRAEIALTYIYGIGPVISKKIIKAANINPDKRAKDFIPEEISKIQSFVEKNIKVEGELRQFIKQNLERLKNIQSYRGLRHIKKLPVRGQRTRRNTRTVRGNTRKTVGSGRRKVDLK